ncbi:MAG TPA: cytidylate kinase-like family protein [Gemmataceae bacterium]|nr:cytidylate kinase-like family protein [Gemmataceae bacterium]
MNTHDLSLSVVHALVGSHATVETQPPREQTPPRRPFTIAISREVGALGSTVGREVGRLLGWPVHDREILEKIAAEMQRPTFHLDFVDERASSWLEESLVSLLGQFHVRAGTYLKYLIGTVRGLGEVGRCVIVGRGASFILPAETTLRVRLVASPEDRAKVVAARLGVSVKEATSWMEKTERQRIEFVKRTFKIDGTDSHQFDMVLNMSRLTVEEAAEAIVRMLERFERRNTPAGESGGAARSEPHTMSPAAV